MTFADRHEAGRKLAEKLLSFQDRDPVVLALPRGGVPVGYEIARALSAPLDLVLVRKLGAPGQPELAIGAIALGIKPEIVTDQNLIAELGVTSTELAAIQARELQELGRRRERYCAHRPPVPLAGRTAILVDDGIATGATMRAALRATRAAAPAHLVLAVPVAPPETLTELAEEADEIVCLERPRRFFAVGQFYRSFSQLEDQEVLDLLNRARLPPTGRAQ
ncbi:MAG: phosphoribosyltransferase [Rhodospirillales bacterium]|nr:phosphoribosyltransferase [Rhodospirillales bacterium]